MPGRAAAERTECTCGYSLRCIFLLYAGKGDFICFRVSAKIFAAGCVLLLVVMCLVSVLVAVLLTRFLTRKPVVERLREVE